MKEEIARILRAIADRVEAGELQGKVLDLNGNWVGQHYRHAAVGRDTFNVSFEVSSAAFHPEGE